MNYEEKHTVHLALLSCMPLDFLTFKSEKKCYHCNIVLHYIFMEVGTIICSITHFHLSSASYLLGSWGPLPIPNLITCCTKNGENKRNQVFINTGLLETFFFFFITGRNLQILAKMFLVHLLI